MRNVAEYLKKKIADVGLRRIIAICAVVSLMIAIAVILLIPSRVDTLTQELIEGFNSNSIEKISEVKEALRKEVSQDKLPTKEAFSISENENVRTACAEFFARNLNEGNYVLLKQCLSQLYKSEGQQTLSNNYLSPLRKVGLDAIQEYVDNSYLDSSFNEAVAGYGFIQEQLGSQPDVALMPYQLIKDNLLPYGTVLTMGMPGYYFENTQEHDIDETSSYVPGFGSALKTLKAGGSWSYFGDYAIHRVRTARDNLDDGFTYSETENVFYKGKELKGFPIIRKSENDPFTLAGIITMDNYVFIPAGKLNSAPEGLLEVINDSTSTQTSDVQTIRIKA